MELYSNNNKVKRNNTNNIEDLLYLQVSWPADSNKHYSLLIYDETGEIYCLIVNIRGNNILSGDIIQGYIPIAPSDNKSHSYIIALFLQNGKLSINRNNYTVEDIVNNENFTLIEHILLVANNNSYYIESNMNTITNPDIHLADHNDKYCKCILDVATKQPALCNKDKAWYQEIEGKKCYNPYAICAKSTKTSTRGCFKQYNYNALSNEQLIAVASLKGMNINLPFNREGLIRDLQVASNY